METHRPDAPITLDRLNRQLQRIAQKVNRALKPPVSVVSIFSGLQPATPGQVDAAVLATAMAESDALLAQVRSACEHFSTEPSVKQLEAAVWMQRAKLEHCAARFRQASAAYEVAAKMLIEVERHRAPLSTTEDALNQSVSCILYACAELVEAADRKFRLQQNSNAAAAAAATSSTIQSNNAAAAAAAMLAAEQAKKDATSSSSSSSSSPPPGVASSVAVAEQPKTLGNRLSSWFKGLPSIQPANSAAAQMVAEEQEAIRRQRELDKATKMRCEAVWRLLPADCPHRFVSTTRITVLLRYMASELLKMDAVDLASHFADLSARYCLDYVTPSGAGEVVPPPATVSSALVPVKTALCRLPLIYQGRNQPQTASSKSPDLSPFTMDPDVEFCAVKPIACTVRHIFSDSILLSVGCSLVLRQFERVRVMATFGLFVLEPQRGQCFDLSVPDDMQHRNSAAALLAASHPQPQQQQQKPPLVVIPSDAPTCYFVPVTIMKSFSLQPVRMDENCALIGLSIVLAALCMRRVPFLEIASAHVSWWRSTFADLHLPPPSPTSTTSPTAVGESDSEQQKQKAAAMAMMSSSEFLAWRLPVADALENFVVAVEASRKEEDDENDGSRNHLRIFAAVDKLRQPLLRRNQMLGLAAHRLYEIYTSDSEGIADRKILSSIVKSEVKRQEEQEVAANNSGKTTSTLYDVDEAKRARSEIQHAERRRAESNSSPKLQ